MRAALNGLLFWLSLFPLAAKNVDVTHHASARYQPPKITLEAEPSVDEFTAQESVTEDGQSAIERPAAAGWMFAYWQLPVPFRGFLVTIHGPNGSPITWEDLGEIPPWQRGAEEKTALGAGDPDFEIITSEDPLLNYSLHLAYVEVYEETALGVLVHRYLHPRLGHFTTPDFRTPNIYDPTTLTQPYAYANGNPIMFLDLDGLRWIYFYSKTRSDGGQGTFTIRLTPEDYSRAIRGLPFQFQRAGESDKFMWPSWWPVWETVDHPAIEASSESERLKYIRNQLAHLQNPATPGTYIYEGLYPYSSKSPYRSGGFQFDDIKIKTGVSWEINGVTFGIEFTHYRRFDGTNYDPLFEGDANYYYIGLGASVDKDKLIGMRRFLNGDLLKIRNKISAITAQLKGYRGPNFNEALSLEILKNFPESLGSLQFYGGEGRLTITNKADYYNNGANPITQWDGVTFGIENPADIEDWSTGSRKLFRKKALGRIGISGSAAYYFLLDEPYSDEARKIFREYTGGFYTAGGSYGPASVNYFFWNSEFNPFWAQFIKENFDSQ